MPTGILLLSASAFAALLVGRGKQGASAPAAPVAPSVHLELDWGPRVALGMVVLYRQAIEGFAGQKGLMPARGGHAALSDDGASRPPPVFLMWGSRQ